MQIGVKNVERKKTSVDNMGASSKASKGSSVLLASFRHYFCRGRIDDRMATEDGNFCEMTGDGKRVSSAVGFSPVYSCKEGKGCGFTEGCQGLNLAEDSFPPENGREATLPRKVAPVETEERDKEQQGVSGGNVHTRTKIPTPSKRTGSVTLSVSGKHVALKEIALSILSPSKRKRFRTGNDGSKGQNRKDPLVILAWANWVSYESDEEGEEPLIKRRSERRKRERRGELFEKTMSDPGHVAIPLGESQSPRQTRYRNSTDRKRQEDTVNWKLSSDCKEEMSKNASVSKNNFLVNLSDYKINREGTVGGNHQDTPHMCDHKQEFPEKALVYLHEWNMDEDGWECTMESPKTVTGHDLVLLGRTQQTRRETTTKTGTDVMQCPICCHPFRETELNSFVNEHIDHCLLQSSK